MRHLYRKADGVPGGCCARPADDKGPSKTAAEKKINRIESSSRNQPFLHLSDRSLNLVHAA
jgi:hypothetical protein